MSDFQAALRSGKFQGNNNSQRVQWPLQSLSIAEMLTVDLHPEKAAKSAEEPACF